MDSVKIPPLFFNSYHNSQEVKSSEELPYHAPDDLMMLDNILEPHAFSKVDPVDLGEGIESWNAEVAPLPTDSRSGEGFYKDYVQKKRRRSSILEWANLLQRRGPSENEQFSSAPIYKKEKLMMKNVPPKKAATNRAKANGRSNLLFACPHAKCNQKYSNSEHLKLHLKAFHSKGKPVETNYRSLALTPTYILTTQSDIKYYLCPFPGCSCKYKSSEHLIAHMDQHNEGNRRYFRCGICNETFYSAGCLKSHKISHFKDTNTYVCEVPSCGKQYSTAEGLRLHVRNHHQVNKKWKCMAQGCSRSFVRQADLRMHIIRMHTEGRPFPCTVGNCNKAFACHSELRRHAIAFHNVVIPAIGKQNKQQTQPPLVAELLEKAVEYQKTLDLD